MPGLSRVRLFKDDGGRCWSSVILASGEPCWISVAPSSVVVKRSRIGLLGARLYKGGWDEASAAAKALADLLPASLLPRGFTNPVLGAFTNAALHCANSGEVYRLLNEATILSRSSRR
jgi:hypothetical protein